MGNDITLPPLLVPLVATIVVAGIAFMTRCRMAFATGALACWIVALKPRPREYIEWRPGTTFEHMLLHDLQIQWQDYLAYIPIAAVVGTTLGLIISQLLPKDFWAERKPFDMTQLSE